MDGAVSGNTERVYVGRFSIEVPAHARRFGETYELRDLRLRDVAFAAPLDKAFEVAWSERLAQIAQLKTKRLDPTYIDGTIEAQVDIEQGRFRAVVYHSENLKDYVAYAGLRDAQGAGVWISRAGPLTSKDEYLKEIAFVGKAYQPLPSGEPASKADLFHLTLGVVALPFQEQESATAIFKGGPWDVEIELSTESTIAPKGGGLMARFGDAVAKAGAAFAAGLSPVRNRGRVAAGMKGEEFVMRDSGKGKLYFMWEYKGEANSGARPKIQLQLRTKVEEEKQKMAAWDALVDSLQPAVGP
jgi:Tle cognate immunity protein 4 C-terminal domain